MSPLMKALGIDRLSPEEQLALADDIYDSLGDDRPVPPLSPARRAELARRGAELDTDPASRMTWAELRAFIENPG